MQPAEHRGQWQKGWAKVLAVTVAVLTAGCTSIRVTEPVESATEQLLVTRAIDDAVDKLNVSFDAGMHVFVDASYFDGAGVFEGIPREERDQAVLFPKYAIGAIRDRLLRTGALLVQERKDADLVVELRTGGQSVDHNSLFIGLPSLSLPIPLTYYPFSTIPELALFKRDRQTGVAKLAITAYHQATGELAGSSGPVFGASNHTETIILLVIDRIDSDIEPKELQNRTH